jgi:hypothetical protein
VSAALEVCARELRLLSRNAPITRSGGGSRGPSSWSQYRDRSVAEFA